MNHLKNALNAQLEFGTDGDTMQRFQSIHDDVAKEIFGRPSPISNTPTYDGDLALLAFTNRSGSNLLASYMKNSYGFGQIGELLNAENIKARSSEREISSFPEYVRDLYQQTNPHNRIFGLKASAAQIAMLYYHKIFSMFKGVKVVHCYRNDVVAQAVSFSIAFQTKQWTSRHGSPEKEVEYDFQDIQKRISAILFENQQIIEICSLLELPKIEVKYEDLEARPRMQIRRIFQHFSLNEEDMKFKKPHLKKQRTSINEEFCSRFRSEAKMMEFEASLTDTV